MNVEGFHIPRDHEQAVVWMMLHDGDPRNSFALDVFQALSYQDFGDLVCNRMAQIIHNAVQHGRSIDLDLACHQYHCDYKEDEAAIKIEIQGWNVGSGYYIPPHILDDYLRIILKSATNRRIVVAGQKIAQLGVEGNLEPGEVVSQAHSVLDEWTKNISQGIQVITPQQRSELIKARHEQRIEDRCNGVSQYVQFGFRQLDAMTNGMKNGCLYIVGGWSSDGKSTLLWTIARNVSNLYGKRVVFVTIEMMEEHLSDRDMAGEINVNSRLIETAMLSEDEEKAFYEAADLVAESNIFIYEKEPIYVEDLYTLLYEVERHYGKVDLLVTDYLQIMESHQKFRTREEEVAYLATTHRKIAKAFNIPVLTASQFNEEVTKRDNKKPTMNDWRESRRIVHEATGLIGLYIPSRAKDKTLETQADWDKHPLYQNYVCPKYQTELVMCKWRNSDRDINIRVGWNPQTSRHFDPVEKQSTRYSESVAPAVYNGNGRNAPPMPPYNIDDMDF